MHEFRRPDTLPDSRMVGERWSEDQARYDEGVRYVYRHGAHELTLFWNAPADSEVKGLRDRPVEVGLYMHPPAAFLLYKIQDVCEWSDVAFNVQMVHEAEREIPNESPGDRARLKIDLVMTQALKHVMREQAATPFVREDYDDAVRMVQHRFPDSDALVRVAEYIEPTLG